MSPSFFIDFIKIKKGIIFSCCIDSIKKEKEKKIMKIVKPRSIETLEVKVLTFHNKGLTENRDFSFPCDDNGNINTKDSNYRLWKENYERCLSEAKRRREI